MTFRRIAIFSAFILSLSSAREIVFPPVAAVHPSGWGYQSPLAEDDVLLQGGAFRGLTTWANLPYVQCLSGEQDIEPYDIAILGAPFDTVSQKCDIAPGIPSLMVISNFQRQLQQGQVLDLDHMVFARAQGESNQHLHGVSTLAKTHSWTGRGSWIAATPLLPSLTIQLL